MIYSEFGNNIRYKIFGTTHGDEIGVEIFGFPKDVNIDENRLADFMERRRPLGIGETSRQEPDKVKIISFSPFKAVIKNEDAVKSAYIDNEFRPNHGDAELFARYGEKYNEVKGHFSGRLTAPLCIAGGIAIQLLEKSGIKIKSDIVRIGSATDASFFEKEIKSAEEDGDSVGGIVECRISGVPAGIGNPHFEGLENEFSKVIFGIPGIKGIEFGAGFRFAEMRGLESLDIDPDSNNSGGINSGVSNGKDIIVRVAVKPTPTISKLYGGRNDVCIARRLCPVLEAAVACVLYDFSVGQLKHSTLDTARAGIDAIDRQLSMLLDRRANLVKEIGKIKKSEGICVLSEPRQEEVLKIVSEDRENIDYIRKFYRKIFKISIEKEKPVKRKIFLLGTDIKKSVSPEIHSLFDDYGYEIKEIKKEEFKDFILSRNYDGLNITMPFKQEIIKYIDEISPLAKRIGAVNTVVNKNGRLYGYNTDYFGFGVMCDMLGRNSFEFDFHGLNVLILGNGGTSRTVREYVQNHGADNIYVASRSGTLSFTDAVKLDNIHVVINTLPVDIGFKTSLVGAKYIIDVRYSPRPTEFIKSAEHLQTPAIGGIYMLIAQAMMSNYIFSESFK